VTTSGRFCWYELRTTAPAAARAFYAEAVGLDLEDAPDRVVWRSGGLLVGEVTPLPAQAAARGAPPHWLGHVGVADVDATTRRFVDAGAERLGPPRRSAEGDAIVALRDPFGAVVALTSRAAPAGPGGPAWHELHTADHRRAWSTYNALFGWRATGALDLGPPLGEYGLFAWSGADRDAGGMLSSARLPGVHPHWLFYFGVDDLDRRLARVVARGGRALQGPLAGPSGGRVVPCEDPQGAAFALYEAPASPR
jgi:hypothetical protein